MTSKTVFGIIALLPAALGPLTSSAGSLVAALCTGVGHSRSVTIPMQPTLPGADGMCCAKGCHSGSSKKRPGCDKVGDD